MTSDIMEAVKCHEVLAINEALECYVLIINWPQQRLLGTCHVYTVIKGAIRETLTEAVMFYKTSSEAWH